MNQQRNFQVWYWYLESWVRWLVDKLAYKIEPAHGSDMVFACKNTNQGFFTANPETDGFV